MAQIERRLAAVMLADIAGYSALMEHAESRTYQRVRTMHEELVNPIVARYGGRIIKTTGDGFLAEFSSSTAALLCGIDIQRLNHAREATKDEAERFHLRIGINLGDIIIDGDDISGDGVNVAARLEPLAPNDGICVSGAVRDQIREDMDVVFEDLGEQQVKNISRPIRAYRISLTDAPLSNSVVRRKMSWQWLSAAAICGVVLVGVSLWYWSFHQTARVISPSVPGNSGATIAPGSPDAVIAPLSILVLPFSNQTGDPQKAYIADALTTSITSDLSRIRDAFIIPPATAFTYKDKVVSVQQVGKDAGVHFVLQGSVLSSGETVRISVQLANTLTGAQLWSESFAGELTKLFALQDKVTTAVVNSIGREMVIVAARESEMRQSSPKATDLMLRARALSLKPQSLQNLQQLEAWYRQVLAMEPNNAGAMVGLARSLTLQAFNFGRKMAPDEREKNYSEGKNVISKARELDRDDPSIYGIMALYAATHDDFDGQRRACETWLSLEPKNPNAYNFLANVLVQSGEAKRAAVLLTQAIDLDPKHPSPLVLLGMSRVQFTLGDNDATIAWSQKALDANPKLTDPYPYLAMAYALKGDDTKARATVADLVRADPNFKLTEFKRPMPSSPAAYKEWFENKYLPAARKASLPE